MDILLLEDHQLFASGLIKLIEEHFPQAKVSSYATVQSLKGRVSKVTEIDLLISDIEIPNEDVFELLEPLASQVPILVLSMHNKLPVIAKCQKIGVKGYMLKDDNNIELAISEILKGNCYFSNKVEATLELIKEFRNDVLSPREEEIIKSLAQGKNTNDIAESLFVSPNTIATHRKNIYRKLNLNNVAEITKYYYENYI